MAAYSQYIEHKAHEGERWDDLARIYYGDCFKIEPIISANPDVPISPFLPSGTVIIVPILNNRNPENEGLPVWMDFR